MPEDAPVIKMFLPLRRSMCAPVISVFTCFIRNAASNIPGRRWNISKLPRD